MSDITMNRDMADVRSPRPHLDSKPHVGGAIAFLLVLVAGLGYAAFKIWNDISNVDKHNLAIGAFVLLGIALLGIVTLTWRGTRMVVGACWLGGSLGARFLVPDIEGA